MSRPSSPSPAPDAASQSEHSEHSPARHESATAEDSSQSVEETSKQSDDSNAAKDSSTSASPSASTPAPDSSATTSNAASTGTWQAVWSPAHNAYYFYNSVTHETTWVNPLQSNAEAGPSNQNDTSATPTDPTQASASAASSTSYDIYAAAVAQGIDPALAHLDPSLLASSSTTPAAFTYTAKFNSRTGAFTRPDGRDPTHLSEYERAKRMSEFYFDVNAWEHEVEKRKLEEAQEEESRKRKKPTKKDLERFKEQKRQKKLAKTAWLRT